MCVSQAFCSTPLLASGLDTQQRRITQRCSPCKGCPMPQARPQALLDSAQGPCPGAVLWAPARDPLPGVTILMAAGLIARAVWKRGA